MPLELQSLPMSVVELATDLFARQYGLSGAEIHRVFASYTDVLGTYPMADKPSRWMIFRRGLDALDEDNQCPLLADLLDREWPNLESSDLDRLRQQLTADPPGQRREQ